MRLLIVIGIALVALTGCGADVPTLPPQSDPAMAARQAQAFIEAMKPRRPGRPVIAVVARNAGTETTDFLITHAVLQRADVADVQVVALRRGRVSLYPALEVEVAQDLTDFNRTHPAGADYVIVPAMDDANEPALSDWLQQQAAKGARIVGVCAGALIVGRAGLLDGRRFTTHWFFRDSVLERHPGAVYVPHERYVADHGIATTTGVTASMPAMLALVEAIGGRQRAQALAGELGVEAWTPAHDSSRFGLNASRAARYALARAAFWRHEDWRVDVHDGMDDIALAFAADAWSRTGHVRVQAAAPDAVKLRSGVVLAAQPLQDSPRMPLDPSLKPVQQLERTLCEIDRRFGPARREWVMIELEYPGDANACAG